MKSKSIIFTIVFLFIVFFLALIYYITVNFDRNVCSTFPGSEQGCCEQYAMKNNILKENCVGSWVVGNEGCSWKCEVPGETCAEAGSIYATDGSLPNKCCDGLENVWLPDYISVEGKCYKDFYEFGLNTFGKERLCVNCGDGICGDGEDFCNCQEDCKDKSVSDYKTRKEFCDLEWNEESIYFKKCQEGDRSFLCEFCD